MCVLEMDFPVKSLGLLQWSDINNHVIYEEIFRLMITFFNYKDNVTRVSQIF